MLKKLFSAACLILLCQTTCAENCPTVADIKKNNIAGWKILDSDEGTPLSAKRQSQYINGIKEFALAEWTNHGKNVGTIHCYYRDNNGSELEAFLTKDNFVPTNAKNYWYQVSGSMDCAAGSEKCAFSKGQSTIVASN